MINTEPIIKEVIIDAALSSVWRVLTEKEELKQWYFPFEDFQAKPGFEFKFLAGGENNRIWHLCKVLEVEPEKKISYTWEYENLPGTSVVSFELFDERGKTKLKLTHDGVESFAANGPEFSRENFVTGWEHVTGIKTYLEKPRFNIKKSVLIDAPAGRVWEVITDLNLIKQWASAFYEGTYAETSWEVGTGVEWKTGPENVCAKGVVSVNEPNKVLKSVFYEPKLQQDFNPDECCNFEFSDVIGNYSEGFEFEEQGGKVLLKATAGPLMERYYEMLDPLWDKAMVLMKDISEKN